ncbi:TPA: hypothetical protein DCZ46_02640 [Candidatus Campbellbacteria bacterium]|nr:MAG: hypothetical protein UR58_C0001G0508 [Candidatus Campbellbacteria bacterium GW2011_OD1_34_28]KKP74972.1 MAG: hypothetical protein UR74_C0002G0238 [Candidatus Campbellbacteria bacterium GW2011_GWD2_35_24]KKP75858.1 MAG: hypothetical protein UR75_C0002G0239 [Candidatus Campbellbacteria bacterium GW2011_GWC2_35_28]KKP76894.1 MAG: hypothetical protein UR76_C0002G0095 [Candidatus Campbellbacteria bacterium GW2011_GWC1_35_31]KKP78820.1 MAG: hypothetical protein UR79_C0002G0095 [Candidatus Cam
MNKGSAGYEIAKYLQDKGGKDSFINIVDSLKWDTGFTNAVVRDMKDLRKTIEVKGGMVYLTDVGVAELARLQ